MGKHFFQTLTDLGGGVLIDHLAGREWKSEVWSNSQIQARTWTTWTHTTTNLSPSRTGVADRYRPRFVYATEKSQDTFDGAGGVEQSRTTYTYDTYGNTTEIHELGDTDVSGDDRTTARGFNIRQGVTYLRNPGFETVETLRSGPPCAIEGDGTWNECDDTGTIITATYVTDPHWGARSLRIDSAGYNAHVNQMVWGVVMGARYRCSAYIKSPTGSTVDMYSTNTATT